MFTGQPYCPGCGYEGPDFLWTWHPFRDFWALVQHRETLDLRVVRVPDDEVFYRRSRADPGTERERTAYVESVVVRQLRPGERHVPPAEFMGPADFARFVTEDDRPTDLPCPRCPSRLRWRHTGIA